MENFPEYLKKMPSPIHGDGLFTQRALGAGETLFIAGDFNHIPIYPIQLVNHSKAKANLIFKKAHPYYYAVTKKAIQPGEELLLDYSSVNPRFLSDKDKKMLNDTTMDNNFSGPGKLRITDVFGTDAENLNAVGIADDTIKLPYNYYLSQGTFQVGDEQYDDAGIYDEQATFYNAGGRRKKCKELGLKPKDCTKELRKSGWKKGQEVPLKIAIKAEKAGGKPAAATAPTAFAQAKKAASAKALEVFKTVQSEAQAGLDAAMAQAQAIKNAPASSKLKYAGIAMGGVAALVIIGFLVKKFVFKSGTGAVAPAVVIK